MILRCPYFNACFYGGQSRWHNSKKRAGAVCGSEELHTEVFARLVAAFFFFLPYHQLTGHDKQSPLQEQTQILLKPGSDLPGISILNQICMGA
jgi:hypothetical protein